MQLKSDMTFIHNTVIIEGGGNRMMHNVEVTDQVEKMFKH